MNFIKTEIEGLVIVEPKVFGDHRGFFMESWSERAFAEAGLNYTFVQDNHSSSTVKGTLRGIHFQRGDKAQAKLVRCVRGRVLDVAVELSEENKRMVMIPRGFGHCFVTLTDNVEFLYKADNPYAPESEGGIRWNDPELNIDWGLQNPVLSDKDKVNPFLKDAVTDY